MNTQIDFSTYSLEELYSSAEKVDRDTYPERALEIERLIIEKENEIAQNNPESLQVAHEATRGDRLLGAIIDGIVHILATIPFFMFIGMEKLQDPDFATTAQGLLYGLLVTLILQGYLLYYYSQTVGKHFMGTRIEHLDGSRANIKTILKRILPMTLMTAIPGVGQLIAGLVDPLCIFGKEKRCLHDYIAKTRVCYVSEARE